MKCPSDNCRCFCISHVTIFFLGKDSCQGDSGGPVVYRPDINSNFHQVGLVSFGTRICGIGIPGVYTKISSFLDWIDENLEE